MAEQKVCTHNKYGYCKFQEKCRNLHIKEKCENVECEIQNCVKRHPRECQYYRSYGRCKFSSYCFYDHKNFINRNDDFKKEYEAKIKEVDEQNREMNEKIVCLTKNLEVQTSTIKKLEQKLASLNGKENIADVISDLIKRSEVNFNNIENLDKKVKENGENNFILVHAVDDLERAVKSIRNELQILTNDSQSYPCNVCSQVFNSETTLRNHIRRYHGTFKT